MPSEQAGSQCLDVIPRGRRTADRLGLARLAQDLSRRLRRRQAAFDQADHRSQPPLVLGRVEPVAGVGSLGIDDPVATLPGAQGRRRDPGTPGELADPDARPGRCGGARGQGLGRGPRCLGYATHDRPTSTICPNPRQRLYEPRTDLLQSRQRQAVWSCEPIGKQRRSSHQQPTTQEPRDPSPAAARPGLSERPPLPLKGAGRSRPSRYPRETSIGVTQPLALPMHG